MTPISIFNGRQRVLGDDFGETGPRVFIQIDVRFLEALHQFHGAALSVLIALALRSNENGWSWPSIETLQRDTGLSRNSVFRALDYLCSQRINGQRVLLRARLRNPDGTLGTNCYLLFPTPVEEEEYRDAELVEYPVDAPTKYQKVVRGNHVPSTTFTNVVKLHPNNNHGMEHDIDDDDDDDNRRRSETTPASPVRPESHEDNDPIFAEALAMYESEIGVVSPIIAEELKALSAEIRDLARWREAFRSAAGANVRRWSYVKACLQGGRKCPLPAATRQASGPGRARPVRARVVTPEEMPPMPEEEPLPPID